MKRVSRRRTSSLKRQKRGSLAVKGGCRGDVDASGVYVDEGLKPCDVRAQHPSTPTPSCIHPVARASTT